MTDLVAAAVPDARLLDDERREFDEVRDVYDDLDDDDRSGGLDPDDPEVRRSSTSW